MNMKTIIYDCTDKDWRLKCMFCLKPAVHCYITSEDKGEANCLDHYAWDKEKLCVLKKPFFNSMPHHRDLKITASWGVIFSKGITSKMWQKILDHRYSGKAFKRRKI
jgi:hypothetical protein